VAANTTIHLHNTQKHPNTTAALTNKRRAFTWERNTLVGANTLHQTTGTHAAAGCVTLYAQYMSSTSGWWGRQQERTQYCCT
jgi:hypothetical protein